MRLLPLPYGVTDRVLPINCPLLRERRGAGIDKIGLEVGGAAIAAAAAVTSGYGWITIKYSDHHDYHEDKRQKKSGCGRERLMLFSTSPPSRSQMLEHFTKG
jgi:hypothetical protein